MSLEIATKIARANPSDHWKLGAVVRKGGRVLAVGWNVDKNVPENVEMDWAACSVHAEVSALKQVSDPSGSIVYVARVTRGGRVGMAKPCKRCRAYLTDVRVKRAVYTIDENTFGVWKP